MAAEAPPQGRHTPTERMLPASQAATTSATSFSADLSTTQGAAGRASGHQGLLARAAALAKILGGQRRHTQGGAVRVDGLATAQALVLVVVPQQPAATAGALLGGWALLGRVHLIPPPAIVPAIIMARAEQPVMTFRHVGRPPTQCQYREAAPSRGQGRRYTSCVGGLGERATSAAGAQVARLVIAPVARDGGAMRAADLAPPLVAGGAVEAGQADHLQADERGPRGRGRRARWP